MFALIQVMEILADIQLGIAERDLDEEVRDWLCSSSHTYLRRIVRDVLRIFRKNTEKKQSQHERIETRKVLQRERCLQEEVCVCVCVCV